MDLWEDDVPWGNMAITALKVGTAVMQPAVQDVGTCGVCSKEQAAQDIAAAVSVWNQFTGCVWYVFCCPDMLSL